jgi:hypothetical protein
MGQRYKENRLLAVEQEVTDRQIGIYGGTLRITQIPVYRDGRRNKQIEISLRDN